MRMMKNNRNETIMVIGIDHGYGNMKTATRCFPSGVARYDKEPIFQNNLLVYNGMYYQIGEEHKEFCAEKTQDEDYYVLTLAAIARELDGKGMNRAKVHIAAGLPLTWVATQKEDFQKYLLQNECVDFTFRNKEYHVEFAGADIYPQGFAAAFYRLQDFKGINMLVDIGNGTMNIMYINNSRPLEKKCFTEKYGTHLYTMPYFFKSSCILGILTDRPYSAILSRRSSSGSSFQLSPWASWMARASSLMSSP